MKRFLLGLMLVAACSKGSGGGAKSGDDCGVAVAHMAELQKTGLPKGMPEAQLKKLEAVVAKTGEAIAASCREMKWSKEAVTCIKDLKSVDEAKQCDDKFTPEQRKAAEKAAETAMEEAQKPSADDKSAALKGITALRDEMCACKDAACGEAVYKKWGDVEKASEGARHDEATKEAWNKIDDELMKCKGALK